MDVYVIVLRLIHIFGGIYWVGTAFFLAAVLIPAANRMGDNSTSMVGPIYSSSVFGIGFAASSLATTVAGLLLWWEVSDGFNSDYMGSDGGIVLSIGAAAGILAFGHGLMAMGKYSREYATAYTSSPPDATALANAEKKIAVNSRISLGLMIVAVVGMSAARYV